MNYSSTIVRVLNNKMNFTSSNNFPIGRDSYIERDCCSNDRKSKATQWKSGKGTSPATEWETAPAGKIILDEKTDMSDEKSKLEI